MHVTRSTVVIDTDASGDATGYTSELNGLLSCIQYAKDDYADGVDFTITEEDTGRTLWTEADVNASTIKAPRQATYSTAGLSALYAGGGEAVFDLIPIRGRVKIVIAQGGNAKSGAFTVTVISLELESVPGKILSYSLNGSSGAVGWAEDCIKESKAEAPS